MESSIFDETALDIEKRKNLAYLVKMVRFGINAVVFFLLTDVLYMLYQYKRDLMLLFNWQYILLCIGVIIGIVGSFTCKKAPLLSIGISSVAFVAILLYAFIKSPNTITDGLFFKILILVIIFNAVKNAINAQKLINSML